MQQRLRWIQGSQKSLVMAVKRYSTYMCVAQSTANEMQTETREKKLPKV